MMTIPMTKQTKRQRYELVRTQLDNDYSTFQPQYRDLNDYILPTRARFFISDNNRGDRRNLKILDSTATMAARTLSSGMMSGVTSPARRWFKLETPDPDLNKLPSVKDWLYQVSEIMYKSIAKSNFYQTKPLVYGDLGTFGTAAYLVEKDYNTVLFTKSFPVGSYRIAKNARGVVDTFTREFQMTIQQLLEEFGEFDPNGNFDWSNFSPFVKQQYDLGMYNVRVDVVHVVMPNFNYNPEYFESKFKKFVSCYYEKGSSSAANGMYLSKDADVFLSEKGYDYFPVLVPRWEVAGEDVYATNCPGMVAIGDVKQLQHGVKRMGQAIDTIIRPPMKGPSTLRNQKASILPGDITYNDERDGQGGFKPVYQIDPRIQEMEMMNQACRERIKTAYFENLFLMMASSDRREITAREIDERAEEKLLALGPVMEQINQDDLDPFIDITFQACLELGLLPQAPDELRGTQLSIEYISIMAQAQKMIGLGAIERYMGFAGNVAATYPGSLKKTNANKILDAYGDMVSLPPGAVRSDEEVAEMEQQEAQAIQAQQRQEAIASGAKAAKDLAGANLDGDNALNRMLEGMPGGTVPTA